MWSLSPNRPAGVSIHTNPRSGSVGSIVAKIVSHHRILESWLAGVSSAALYRKAAQFKPD